jgi:hypothetical protein
MNRDCSFPLLRARECQGCFVLVPAAPWHTTVLFWAILGAAQDAQGMPRDAQTCRLQPAPVCELLRNSSAMSPAKAARGSRRRRHAANQPSRSCRASLGHAGLACFSACHAARPKLDPGRILGVRHGAALGFGLGELGMMHWRSNKSVSIRTVAATGLTTSRQPCGGLSTEPPPWEQQGHFHGRITRERRGRNAVLARSC